VAFCRRMRSSCRDMERPEQGQVSNPGFWYRAFSAVRGKDLRDAQPGTDQMVKPNVRFHLNRRRRPALLRFTSAHVGEEPWSGSSTTKCRKVANIKEAIRDTGEISGGSMSQQQAQRLGR